MTARSCASTKARIMRGGASWERQRYLGIMIACMLFISTTSSMYAFAQDDAPEEPTAVAADEAVAAPSAAPALEEAGPQSSQGTELADPIDPVPPPGEGTTVASDAVGAAAAEGWDCNNCPGAVAQVCAEVPRSGIKVTVAHRCIASCQGMTNIRDGTCEVLAGVAGSGVDIATVSTQQAPGAAGPAPPAFDPSCQVNQAEMTKYKDAGLTFIGCMLKATTPPDATASAASTNGGSAKPLKVAELLAAAKPEDTVVVTEHLVESASGALYVKPEKTTAGKLAKQGVGKKGSQGAAFGKKAPDAAAWDSAQDKPPTSTDGAQDLGNSTEAVKGYKILHDALNSATPMSPPPGGSGLRNLLFTENRWYTGSTTTWPWPALVKIAWGCSGSLISPDDVLTAAHCVVDSVSGSYYGPFTIIPGKDNAYEPYGRFAASTAHWWNVWVGGRYNGDYAIKGGSAYVDAAVIHLNRPTTWWVGAGYTCGSRVMALRACGYPGGPTYNGLTPYCSDGSSRSIDYCDATTDYVRSANCITSPGQSGGPVFDRSKGWVTAMVSGGPTDLSDNWYTPLDTFNWKLLFEPSWKITIWASSVYFRATNGLIRSSMNNKCLDTPSATWQTRVHMWDCHGGQNQLWVRPSTSLSDLRLRTYNNLCLDVSGDGRSNGAPVVVHGCHDGTNQKWMYDSKMRLRPWSSPTRCLSIYGAQGHNGAQLVLWDCLDNNSNQKWY